MTLTRLHFPPILDDNSEAYLSLLQGVVEARDHLAQGTVTRSSASYHFRIVPSSSRDLEHLLQDINDLHNLLQLKVRWSKSLKAASNLSFEIPF